MAKKQCFRCGDEKSTELFSKHRGRPDGLQAECKECQKKTGRAIVSKKRREDPAYGEYMRWYFMRMTYGITQEQYEALLQEQGGLCRICGLKGEYAKRPGKTAAGLEAFGLCVDHDHETGKIRGLLCNLCNRGIGMFKDSPDLLEKARAYVSTGGAQMHPAAQRTRSSTAPRQQPLPKEKPPVQSHPTEPLPKHPDAPLPSDLED